MATAALLEHHLAIPTEDASAQAAEAVEELAARANAHVLPPTYAVLQRF